MNKIKQFFKHIGYMLAFGMKGANDEILSQNTVDEGVGVVQQKETKSLWQALLRGELTQQVRELRYKDYKISEESKNYSYVGGGNAIKTKETEDKENVKKYTFVQANSLVCEGVLHELNRINSYGEERYTYDIIYDDIVRFKLESFLSYGEFNVEGEEITVHLYFDSFDKDRDNRLTYAFYNELERITKFTSSYEIERNDICSNTKIISFTTYKPKNEKDLIQYFITDLNYEGCSYKNNYYILTYSSRNFKRTDLTKQFFDSTMNEKYRNKEAKEQVLTLNLGERKEYCDICGEEMNVYDADVTKYTYGKRICVKCLKNIENT